MVLILDVLLLLMEGSMFRQDSLPEPMKEETIQEQLPNEDHESTQGSLQKNEFPEKKSSPLSRNSDGYIVPSGPKLAQSHYADIEIKPKEERPRPPVSGGSTVYATFSKKDPTLPPVPPKQRLVVNTVDVDLPSSEEQRSTTAVEETYQESTGVCFSGVSGNIGQYGPIVPSGKDEVLDSTNTVSYNHNSGEVEIGTNSDSTAVIKTTTQMHVSENINGDNRRDKPILQCTEPGFDSKVYGVFPRLAGNCDIEKQNFFSEESLSEDTFCDSEQTYDVSNDNDLTSSVMIHTQMSILYKVMVSPQPFYPRFENMSVREVENIKVNNEEKEQNKTEKNGQNNEVFPMSSIDYQWWYTIMRLIHHHLPKWNEFSFAAF